MSAGKLVSYEPPWLASPPSPAQVEAHHRRGGRWLCSPTTTAPVFFDLAISAGRVIVRHAGSTLADVLADGDNRTRFAGARWARTTLAGVPMVEVST